MFKSPGYKQLLQTELKLYHWLFFSRHLSKSKTAGTKMKGGGGERKGEERRRIASLSTCFISSTELQSIYFLSPSWSSSFWRLVRLLIQMAHSYRTDQRKTLTFTKRIIAHIPQHLIFSHIWCSVCSSSCFPSSIKHYRDQKKSTLSNSSDTISWNNPFVVKQIRAPIFKRDPMLNMLLPPLLYSF